MKYLKIFIIFQLFLAQILLFLFELNSYFNTISIYTIILSIGFDILISIFVIKNIKIKFWHLLILVSVSLLIPFSVIIYKTFSLFIVIFQLSLIFGLFYKNDINKHKGLLILIIIPLILISIFINYNYNKLADYTNLNLINFHKMNVLTISLIQFDYYLILLATVLVFSLIFILAHKRNSVIFLLISIFISSIIYIKYFDDQFHIQSFHISTSFVYNKKIDENNDGRYDIVYNNLKGMRPYDNTNNYYKYVYEYDPKGNIKVEPFKNKISEIIWSFLGDSYFYDEELNPQIIQNNKILISTSSLPSNCKVISLKYTNDYEVKKGYNFVYTLTYYNNNSKQLMRNIYDENGHLLISGSDLDFGFFVNNLIPIFDSKGSIIKEYDINYLRNNPLILKS